MSSATVPLTAAALAVTTVLPLWRTFMSAAGASKYKSITVEQIAKAMIATSLNTPARSDTYHYPEMMALNR